MLEVIVTPEQLSADGDSRDAEDSQREGVIVRCAHRTLDLWLLNCSSESLGLEADPLADLLHDSQISEITSLKERQAHRGERKPFQKVLHGRRTAWPARRIYRWWAMALATVSAQARERWRAPHNRLAPRRADDRVPMSCGH